MHSAPEVVDDGALYKFTFYLLIWCNFMQRGTQKNWNFNSSAQHFVLTSF